MKAVQENKTSSAPKKLAGKVALITGRSRGIGAAIALRLAEGGAHVAISYAKNTVRASDVIASDGGLSL